MGKEYTNRELARDYFRVAAQHVEDIRAYRFQQRRIAELDIDLPTYYGEHGTFDDLKVKGIGKKTKRILALILDKGVEEARKIVENEKIESMRREQFAGIPNKIPNDDSEKVDYWDNIVRAYERD